jgi:hypothetical protein
MKISKLTSWMGPAFLGTMLSAWASVTLYVLLGKHEPIFGKLVINWLIAVAIATPVAATLAGTMLVLDVFLLKLKVRTLPTGGAAWGMALLSPLPVVAAYLLFRPSFTFGPWGFALSVLAPVLSSALVVRILMGRRINNALPASRAAPAPGGQRQRRSPGALVLSPPLRSPRRGAAQSGKSPSSSSSSISSRAPRVSTEGARSRARSKTRFSSSLALFARRRTSPSPDRASMITTRISCGLTRWQ